MKYRKPWAVAAMVVLLGVASGAATAQSRWIVSGILDFVDDSSRTIEVDGQTLQITGTTRIKRGVKVPGTWEDVVDRDGEHVSALVSPGRPYPLVRTIVLADEVEDE